MGEALSIAFCVGLEGAIAAALVAALVAGGPLRRLAVPFAAAVAAGLAAGCALGLRALSRGLAPAELAPLLQRTEGLYAVALAALVLLARGRSAEELAASRWRATAETLALAAGVLVLLPEGGALPARLRDLALLAEAPRAVVAGAAAGLALAAAAGAGAAWLWARAGAARLLSPASVVALLLALELAGIAARAVDAHTLPLALAGWASRSVHDAVHLGFVAFQVPDHAYLEGWAYQVILVFLEPWVHAALAAVAAAAPVAVAARAAWRRPAAPVPDGARPPARRAARAASLRARRLAAVPFAAALLVSTAAIWATASRGEELYDPVPQPVVDDGAGTIVVPLSGPLAGPDARMRKWVYSAPDGRAVTFFTIPRPDGTIAAALDLCEVCQPKGYAQLGAGYVFCKHCKTPIPVGTVGQPGGCNPIPIPGAEVRGGVLLVPRDAAVRAWESALSRKG